MGLDVGTQSRLGCLAAVVPLQSAVVTCEVVVASTAVLVLAGKHFLERLHLARGQGQVVRHGGSPRVWCQIPCEVSVPARGSWLATQNRDTDGAGFRRQRGDASQVPYTPQPTHGGGRRRQSIRDGPDTECRVVSLPLKHSSRIASPAHHATSPVLRVSSLESFLGAVCRDEGVDGYRP